MSDLRKEFFDRRKRNAERRNYNNYQKAQGNGMTEKEAELVTELCQLRHQAHSNMNSLAVNCDYDGIYKELLRVKEEINETKLPHLDYGSFDKGEYMDIDSFDVLYETETVPEDDDEREQWHDEHRGRIFADLQKLNEIIEDYLAKIDSRYNTSFKPTGMQRMFWS